MKNIFVQIKKLLIILFEFISIYFFFLHNFRSCFTL